MTPLAGRRGVVLGVSGRDSLGYACARRLCADGAEVIATYRDAPGRDSPRSQLLELGCVDAVPVDVLDADAVAAFVADLEARWEGLDFLVHTIMHVPAGALARPLTQLRASEFDAVLRAGAFSLIDVCGRARELLAASGAGRIVTLTSACSRLATPGYHVAGICKGALESAVRYLAFELGPRGITCNAVSAPAIDTAGARRAVGGEPITRTRDHLERRAMTRSATSERDVASAVAWLVGAEAGAVTSQIIEVDGGFATSYF